VTEGCPARYDAVVFDLLTALLNSWKAVERRRRFEGRSHARRKSL